jgi:acetyltransferase-like isoleucine patch superfamily enzyme
MRFIKDFIYLFVYFFKFKSRNVAIRYGVRLSNTYLEGSNRIGQNTLILNSSIGRGSYFGTNCNLSFSSVGRYCSVGDNVQIIRSTHPTSVFISTHPAFYSIRKQAGFTYVKRQKFQELILLSESNYSVSIGNDVWIGSNVTIMAGIKIADGCIIASNAVLTKSTSPYEVWAGVPARCIKTRFTNSEIVELLNYSWWSKDENWIKANAENFENIESLRKMFE